MYAISFDLIVLDVKKNHPKGVSHAYNEIFTTLKKFKFKRIQGSVYVTDTEDMAVLFQDIMALKALPWFPDSVRDIRAFKIEQWSDFTDVVKN